MIAGDSTSHRCLSASSATTAEVEADPRYLKFPFLSTLKSETLLDDILAVVGPRAAGAEDADPVLFISAELAAGVTAWLDSGSKPRREDGGGECGALSSMPRLSVGKLEPSSPADDCLCDWRSRRVAVSSSSVENISSGGKSRGVVLILDVSGWHNGL